MCKLPHVCVAVVAGPLFAAAALAQGAPRSEPGAEALFSLSGYLDGEFNVDRIGGRDGVGRYTDLYNKSELGLTLSMPANLTVEGVFKLEPADRPADGKDRHFDHHAAWIDQLYLQWALGPVAAFAGKIHPRFGLAWDVAPGLYGPDFGEGYELTEKLGAGLKLSLSALAGREDIGEHSLQLEVFRADRGALSSSAFTRRFASTDVDPLSGDEITRYTSRNRYAYGGPDNTRGYRNYVLSLAGEDVPVGSATLQYTLGYASRRAGADARAEDRAATEHGYVAGGALAVPLADDLSFTPMLELVKLDDADGFKGFERDVATVGGELARGPVSVAYTYSRQKDRDDAASSVARQHAASVSYDLSEVAGWLEGSAVTAGWRRLRESGEAANDFGLQFSYAYRFE